MPGINVKVGSIANSRNASAKAMYFHQSIMYKHSMRLLVAFGFGRSEIAFAIVHFLLM